MTNWRVIVVAVVFLASLAALVASTGMAMWSTSDEMAERDRVQQLASRLAESAQASFRETTDEPGTLLSESENRRLASVAGSLLPSDADGGFYLARSDQFAGTVVTSPVPAPLDGEKDVKQAKKSGDKKKLEMKDNDKTWSPTTTRRDPPPLETAMIRQLAMAALHLDPGAAPMLEVRDVGPSRVAVAASPVGSARPARISAWSMVRLTGPEQQKARLKRLQIATALSLAGVLLALGLAAGLVQTLRCETRRRTELGTELRKAEHLAVLGRLLAGVAHEVRNPLAAIRSTVQLWERLPEQARTPESLAAMIGAVDRLNDLVGRLLLFARAGHEKRRLVDLNAVVAETLELIRARAEAQSVTLVADLAQNLPHVEGVGPALGQVVMNLVTNALQAMPTGGTLTCRTYLRLDGHVELAIADTGPGVPVEMREKVFEPFVTTRPDGTGLGLALCREVARQHGGDVMLNPDSASGTVFRLVLSTGEGARP